MEVREAQVCTLCASLYVAQVMPIAKATLYTIKAVNGLAGIAQCFFPGTRRKSQESRGGGREEAKDRRWRGFSRDAQGGSRSLRRSFRRALDKATLISRCEFRV